MKTSNSYKSLLCATLTAALFTACANEELVTNPATDPVDPRPQITIQASLGGNNPADALKPGTRMGYEDDGEAIPGLKTTWTTGDAFNIVPFIDDYGTPCLFTLVKEDNGKPTGKFTGPQPDKAKDGYYAFHPTSIKNIADFDAFSYSGQIQTGNDNRDHLTAYNSFRLWNDSYTTIDFRDTDTFQSSCMKFNLTMPYAIDPVLISLETVNGNKCFFSNNADSKYLYPDADLTSLSLQLKDIKIDAGGTLTAYLMMSTQEVHLSDKIRVTVIGNDGTCYSKDITVATENRTLESGKMHSITVASDWTTSSSVRIYTTATKASEELFAFGEGTAGSAENPYLISNAADLKLLQGVVNGTITGKDNFKDKCYRLTTDILIVAYGTSWTPIGTADNPFNGNFEGNGYSITGLYINNDADSNQGFFGDIESGTVSNLTVEGNITNTGQVYVGGIVGRINTKASIIGCNYRGSVTGNGSGVGGICGSNRATGTLFLGCSNTASVTGKGNTYSGGIVGWITDKTDIIGCYNTGTVTTKDIAGGIVGKGVINDLSGCYNTGDVIGSSPTTSGGIVGTLERGLITATLWVKGNKTTAAEGLGANYSYPPEITSIPTLGELNSIDNLKILNDGIAAKLPSGFEISYKFIKSDPSPILTQININ